MSLVLCRSPEIMDNQKYNSKTDIWSLGCILYELMCLRLPFGGNSMRELVSNIKRATPAAPSSQYSKELRDLVNETLIKNPRQRPGINTILSRPVVRSRITNFLNETKMESEFSHTILHGVDVLRSKPPSRSEPPVAAAPPIVRKLSSVAEEPKRLSPVVAGPPVSIQKQVDSYADYKAKYLQLEKKQQELRMEKAKQEEADRISHVNRMKKDRDAAREADIQRLRQEALKMKAKEEERMKARKEAEAIRLQKEAAAAKARKEAERIRAKKEAEAMQLKREAEAARIRRDSQIAEAKLAEDAIIAQKLQEERRLKAQEKAKIERDRMDGALAAAAAKREEMKRKHRRPSVERELLEAKRIASSEESGNNPFAPLVVNVKEVKAVEERPKLGRAVPSIASRPSKAGKSPKSAHEQNTPLSVVGESPNWMANMKVAISGSDSRPSSGRRPSYAREQLKSEASVNSFQSKIKATDDAINKAKNVLELVNNMKKQQRIESVKEAEKELVRKLDIKNDKAREKLSVGSLSSDDETPAAKAPPMPPRAKSAAELLRAKKPAALAIDDDNSIASGISNDKNTPCSRKKLAESSWFSQFEARMGAIQNQVSEMQLKSPSLNRKPAESPVVAKRESFPVGKPALKPGSVSSRKSMDTPVSRNEAVKAVPVQVTKSVGKIQ